MPSHCPVASLKDRSPYSLGGRVHPVPAIIHNGLDDPSTIVAVAARPECLDLWGFRGSEWRAYAQPFSSTLILSFASHLAGSIWPTTNEDICSADYTEYCWGTKTRWRSPLSLKGLPTGDMPSARGLILFAHTVATGIAISSSSLSIIFRHLNNNSAGRLLPPMRVA
ncbi:hypothetical protein CC78DRAFT_586713 [Lojkania enalia]|uniref:Uncharacterized protein n=1 Tax=Lojkania enalia TaxID=147567 RepID=A0A9P4JX38_9PLEO|nr:hypothetical protein CC78DRAFT_586713 [Didymosphaeria enalia]